MRKIMCRADDRISSNFPSNVDRSFSADMWGEKSLRITVPESEHAKLWTPEIYIMVPHSPFIIYNSLVRRK